MADKTDRLAARLAAGPHEYWRIVLSFRRSLAASRLSDKTIKIYLDTLLLFGDFLIERQFPTTLRDIRREHIEEFFIAQGERTTRYDRPVSPMTLLVFHRGLTRFFRWWLDDAEEPALRNPMAKVKPPQVPEPAVPIIQQEELLKMYRATEGAAFEHKRARAILLILIDTGCRRGELAGMQTTDLDLDRQRVKVTGKFSKSRWLAFGKRTAAALDRYERARDAWLAARRKKDPGYETTALWVGQKGRLTDDGLADIIGKIAAAAGVAGVFPHQFRHTFAHNWLADGGNESDLQELAGWKDASEMLERYARSARGERARQSHKRHSPADKLL